MYPNNHESWYELAHAASIHNAAQQNLPTTTHNEQLEDRRHNSSSQSLILEDLAGIHERSGSLDQQLVQPFSVPIFNGLRYKTTTTQHPAVQHAP